MCGRDYQPVGRRRHCSDACRVAAWRRRHAPPAVAAVPLPPKGRRRAATVYECDTCGERALGAQRCDDCRTFMHRVGTGGCCPACDTPVSIEELVALE